MYAHETLVIVDFGSQVTQLIARRVRECGVYAEIVPPSEAVERIRRPEVRGVVLSGGPSSVYEEGAPKPDPALFDTELPILGICYGMQLLVLNTGGQVESAAEREFGRAEVERLESESKLLEGWPEQNTVWMSHGDSIVALPDGMYVAARTESAPFAAVEDPKRRRYGVQFHPEVRHTLQGTELLRNFALEICGCQGDWTMEAYEQEAIDEIRRTVGDGQVVCALSGGVDSSVMALLIHKAIGERFTAVFVDNGLLRKDEADQVVHTFRDRYHLPVKAVDARKRFLDVLAGVTEPEIKRKRIGHTFIEIFDEEAQEIHADFLAQGTIYPDRIESASTGGPSATIKTHHNVGGLPEQMKLKLVEPLSWLFKDEVRRLGTRLGLDQAFVQRHPFPGPGLAVRILGEITQERIDVLKEADAIFREELETSGWMAKTSQAFAVLLPVRTVGVMGDGRTYEQVVALRSVDTDDFMTADWSRLPHEFLAKVAGRIVGEVRGVNRVVYDITSKPPGTIEWE